MRSSRASIREPVVNIIVSRRITSTTSYRSRGHCAKFTIQRNKYEKWIIFYFM